MIWNIIDDRKRKFRWKIINARIEPTEHDNSCADADEAPAQPTASIFEEMLSVTVEDAVAWAMSVPYGVTLYLGDDGDQYDPAEREISD